MSLPGLASPWIGRQVRFFNPTSLPKRFRRGRLDRIGRLEEPRIYRAGRRDGPYRGLDVLQRDVQGRWISPVWSGGLRSRRWDARAFSNASDHNSEPNRTSGLFPCRDGPPGLGRAIRSSLRIGQGSRRALQETSCGNGRCKNRTSFHLSRHEEPWLRPRSFHRWGLWSRLSSLSW